MIWLSDNLVDQVVKDLISGSALGFFSIGELFHGMYGLTVCVFQCPL